MRPRITLDKAGRVVLPKDLRDRLHLAAGDVLELSVEGERVALQPIRYSPALHKERGVWVLKTGAPLTAVAAHETLRAVRQGRAQDSTGGES